MGNFVKLCHLSLNFENQDVKWGYSLIVFLYFLILNHCEQKKNACLTPVSTFTKEAMFVFNANSCDTRQKRYPKFKGPNKCRRAKASGRYELEIPGL